MSVAVGGERRTEASALLNLMRMWIFVGRTMALLCLRWPVNSHRHRISTRMTIYWLRLKRRYAIAAEEESLNAKGRIWAEEKNDGQYELGTPERVRGHRESHVSAEDADE